MPKVKIGDINMYYEIHGEGESLVVIQGMGADSTSFRIPEQKSKNSQKYQWILFDSRGAGRTDRPDMPYSVKMMAEDTVSLLNAIGIKKAHFFGASLGSRIALVIAAKYPEMVNGLVLVDAAARSPHNDSPQLTQEYEQLRTQIQHPGVVKKMSKYPPSIQSLLNQYDAFMEFDGRDMMGQIKAPTLIVNGSKDTSMPVKYSHELASGIPDAKLLIVEGDHFFMITQPELLFDPMYEFLAEIDSKKATKASDSI